MKHCKTYKDINVRVMRNVTLDPGEREGGGGGGGREARPGRPNPDPV